MSDDPQPQEQPPPQDWRDKAAELALDAIEDMVDRDGKGTRK